MSSGGHWYMLESASQQELAALMGKPMIHLCPHGISHDKVCDKCKEAVLNRPKPGNRFEVLCVRCRLHSSLCKCWR